MSAIFVLPVIEPGRGAPIASLLSTAAWAAAGARLYDRSWIVSPAGVMDPEEARRKATPSAIGSGSARPEAEPSLRKRVVAVPTPVKTLVKDGMSALRGRAFRIGAGPWDDTEVELVWQRHEMFRTAGVDAASRLGVPSVLFAPATKVWEAQRWGTARPGWSGLAERFGEAPAIRRASIVACGSKAVAEQVERLGAAEERIIVTPNGVDVERFADGDRDVGLRLANLVPDDDRFIVGWVGSFRPFHALEQLVAAARGVEGIHLLLVGNGPERERIRAYCAEVGVPVTFTGTVGHDRLPHLLALMDVAAVVADSAESFHYSPLKLGEYLAAGLPVVAPDVATVRGRATDRRDLLLVPPGDVTALRESLRELRDDPSIRSALGRAGRDLATKAFSWDAQLRRIEDRLAATGLRSSRRQRAHSPTTPSD